jgi:hypothetical protein
VRASGKRSHDAQSDDEVPAAGTGLSLNWPAFVKKLTIFDIRSFVAPLPAPCDRVGAVFGGGIDDRF